MRPHGAIVDLILQALAQRPMTRAEICEFTGIDHNVIAPVVTRMSKPSPQRPQRIHIKTYTDELDGMKRYPRAVFALGQGINARKPKRDLRANKRRYLQNLTATLRSASVFNMGMTQRQARLIGYKGMAA